MKPDHSWEEVNVADALWPYGRPHWGFLQGLATFSSGWMLYWHPRCGHCAQTWHAPVDPFRTCRHTSMTRRLLTKRNCQSIFVESSAHCIQIRSSKCMGRQMCATRLWHLALETVSQMWYSVTSLLGSFDAFKITLPAQVCKSLFVMPKLLIHMPAWIRNLLTSHIWDQFGWMIYA